MSEERAPKRPDHQQPDPRIARAPTPVLDPEPAGGMPVAIGVALGTAAPSDPGDFGRDRAVMQRLPSDPMRRQFVRTLGRQHGNAHVLRLLAPDRAPAGSTGEERGGARVDTPGDRIERAAEATASAADASGNGGEDGGPRVALSGRVVPLRRPTTGPGEGLLTRMTTASDIQRMCAACADEPVQRSPAVELAGVGPALPAGRSAAESDGEGRASAQRSPGPAVQRLSLTDGFATIVEQVSPGLAQLIRSGPLTLLIDKIKAGIQSWLSGVLGAVNIGPIISALQSSITGAFSAVMGIVTGDPAGCASFAGTIDSLRKLGQAFMDNPAVQQLQAAFGTVKGLFQKVNELVVAPALDALMSVAGGVFDQVKALASTIWGWAGEVRDYLGEAWDWVKGQLGLGGDGEGGILEWLKSKAAAAWSQVKETLAPVMGPLKTVIGTLLVFSPVGPTILIVKYVPPLVEAVQWLWAHRSDPNIVESAHKQMGNSILPKLLSTVQGFGQAVKGAATEIVNKAVEVGEGVLSLLGAISGVPLLSMARGLVETVSNGLQQLVAWGRQTFQAAADAIVALFEKVKEALAPYIEVLTSLAMAIVNPAAIPVILAGWAWRQLDDCYKPPIIDFLLGIVVRLLRAAPNLPMMGPLWPLLKTGVIAFVEGVKGKDDKTKIALTNKFAKIMSGASPAFIIGFVKGFLIGIWEGLTDPFVLIYSILKGLNSVQGWLEDAATQALTPTPVAAAAGPAGAAGPAPASNRQALAQRVRQMAGELQPPVQTVTTGFMPAIQEAFSGGKGMSFSDLMAKLGEAWTAVEAKIREVGGELADEACQYFLKDAADGEIGEGVGWLAGTITFEVVLGILTAGTYEVLKPLQGIAKVLDWTGEVFGVLFKWLGKVGGWVMDGLRGLRRLLSNAGGSVRIVLDAIGEFGQKLLRYADELAGRIGREAAGEAGERGGRKAAGEAAGREGVQQAGDVPVRQMSNADLAEAGVPVRIGGADHTLKPVRIGDQVQIWLCTTCGNMTEKIDRVLAQISDSGPTKSLHTRLTNLRTRVQKLEADINAGTVNILDIPAKANQLAAELGNLSKKFPGFDSDLNVPKITRPDPSDFAALADRLGFQPTGFRSHGQAVFQRGGLFITPDVDSHIGGVWKMADSVRNLGSKRTRMGTYDADLKRIGD